MIGTYRFYSNGEILGEYSNIITTAGRKAILEFFAGYTKKLVGSLVMGIGSTAANIADKRIEIEVTRSNISNVGVDYANNAVVFRAQIDAVENFTIYEIGAHSIEKESAIIASQIIIDFNEEQDAWTVGTWSATNSRVGSALQITTAGASQTSNSEIAGIEIDISQYSDIDQFVWAYRANNANVASISIVFKTDDANYYTATIATPANGVYSISSINKGSFVSTGTPSWANITKVLVRVVSSAGGAASVDFDAVRLEDADANREESVIVSRAVLGAPVVKTAGLPIDVEYTVTI